MSTEYDEIKKPPAVFRGGLFDSVQSLNSAFTNLYFNVPSPFKIGTSIDKRALRYTFSPPFSCAVFAA